MLLPSLTNALLAASVITSVSAAVLDVRAADYMQARQQRRAKTISARAAAFGPCDAPPATPGQVDQIQPQAPDFFDPFTPRINADATEKKKKKGDKKDDKKKGEKKDDKKKEEKGGRKGDKGGKGAPFNKGPPGAKAGVENTQGGNTEAKAGDLCLNPKVVTTGSAQAGTPAAGQSNSLTDKANFINFCLDKTPTNGLQNKGGSCNAVGMGDIPSVENMISSILTSPTPGQVVAAKKDFKVSVQTVGLVAGSFTDPKSTYYSAPQQLKGGKIVGHTHITIQDMGRSLAPTTPMDPTKFAFFKGINDAGDGNGLLSATVTGGLPPGNYRVCTMTSASNHQCVLMPVAQRGAQDDCTKFTVK